MNDPKSRARAAVWRFEGHLVGGTYCVHLGLGTTMHAASPALIIVALFSACLWSGLLWKMWVLRHAFEIAARAPVFVVISGSGSLTVLLALFVHWILLLEAKGLPCYVMLMASYFNIAVFMSPYFLRACQLVIAYNTQYRLKYARYVKTNNILKVSVMIGVAVCVAAVLVLYNMPERYARGKYGCYFFNERRAVQGTFILGIGPTIFATFKLIKMHDVFGIGPEIVRVIVPMVLVGVFQTTVQELLHANVLEDNHTVRFLLDMAIFLCGCNLLFWSALVPVFRYYGWLGARSMCVMPAEGQISQPIEGKEGIYDYAQEGGEVAEIFGEFCRQRLCMESWEFIMDSVAYKKLADSHEQFTCFIRIVDQYLRPTSPQEVNLGSKMQDRLLSFQTIDMFTRLDEVTRSTILEEPVGEIILMLEQNILSKFKLTPAMQQRQQRKLVEIEIQSARDVADGDEGMLELMTSASLGRMRSPVSGAGAGGHMK